MLLAGDIGATKTRLGFFHEGGGLPDPLADMVFKNALYENLEEIIGEFLARTGMKANRACLGVAGPVTGNSAAMTNINWCVDGERLSREFGIPYVRIINDLLATACAVPFLTADDLQTINRGEAAPSGNMAVIAPGTGLGEAFLIHDGRQYRPYASEGGHGDFAPANALETELFLHLGRRFNHVSYDRLCSGRGIMEIYGFLKETAHLEEQPQIAESIARNDDAVSVILDAAFGVGEKSELCVKTLEVFTSILGAEAGNLALKVLATGGIYIAGGIPLRILPLLTEGRFMEAFLRKGRMAELLARMPVHIVLNPAVALIGAARYLLAEITVANNS